MWLVVHSSIHCQLHSSYSHTIDGGVSIHTQIFLDCCSACAAVMSSGIFIAMATQSLRNLNTGVWSCLQISQCFTCNSDVSFSLSFLLPTSSPHSFSLLLLPPPPDCFSPSLAHLSHLSPLILSPSSFPLPLTSTGHTYLRPSHTWRN